MCLSVITLHLQIQRFRVSLFMLDLIYQTGDSVSSGYPNIEKRVENMMRNGVFLTKFEVIG